MKKLFLAATLFLMSLTYSVAQTSEAEIDFIQSIFGTEKKAFVQEFMKIDYADSFWTVYDEYEVKRKELGKQRYDLLNDYTENLGSITDEKADELMASILKLKKANDKLVLTYYKKVKKLKGTKVASKFYNAENYIASALRISILEGLPSMGDMQ
ncbi:hypothetical protein [Labilibacter marinus]|uniref:hypothetical protein n=1 Tax=Labilibacter marinus TaxID=1477105 RepID=UPI00082F18A7|nr:hypothetical protein [Labilibacter marinus]